ncbi:MAG: hypothetical protein H7A01_14910 [Hahellaceae bacterium]|nr:hypothetical protein [Hahellaceae bacterium]MCP5210347.1 hypothetical protein [Hahellaceae bacterium]
MEIQANPHAFLNRSSGIVGQQNNVDNQNKPQGRPPEGPPPGGIPPGLQPAVATLSEDEQSQVTTMLESLSKEQMGALKNALDELKPQANSMSAEEIGSAFFDMLLSLTESDNDSENLIDEYV